MNEKIPCIESNPELWKYIKPCLKEWGYKIPDEPTNNLNYYPLVVLNWMNYLYSVGFINNSIQNKTVYNRELVTNVEEFLERAARLKGFTYKRKDMKKEFTIDDLQVGMVVEDKNGDRKLILSNSNKELFASNEFDYSISFIDINKVYKIKECETLAYVMEPNNLELIWEKPKETELTMQEIADKFGIPVEQLKIKK